MITLEMKMPVFLGMTSCRLVYSCWSFRRAFCSHIQYPISPPSLAASSPESSIIIFQSTRRNARTFESVLTPLSEKISLRKNTSIFLSYTDLILCTHFRRRRLL